MATVWGGSPTVTLHVRADLSAPPPALELVVCPELAMLVDAAREAAWQTHCNVVGLAYHERKDAIARLRGCLAAYDARRAEAVG